MIEKAFERIAELEAELLKLDYAYVVGDKELTLQNLGVDTTQRTEEEVARGYETVARRIYEIQSLLNVQNQN